MNPHPSTPTPRRFLNKRLASSSQLPPHSTPTPTPMRFQSTPRFVGGSTQSATRKIEDVVEEEEEEEDDDVGTSQSQSSSANEERPLRRSERRGIALLDSIEVDSCADSLTSREGPPSSSSRSSSSSSEHEMDEMDEDGEERRPRGGYVGDGDKVEENAVATGGVHAELTYGDGEEEEGTPKPVKRGRLSSASASASPTKLHMVVVAAAPYDSDTGGQHHHEQDDDTEQDDDDDDEDDGEDDDEDDVQDKTTRTRVPAQQPTFQPAPRFKPAAPEDEPFFASAGQVCTATAAASCSPPPRRGAAKYLAGGLASQLQGLLSKVKGIVETGNNNSNDDNDDDATGAVARVLVEEVRLGARMHLVRGRRILSRGPVAAAQCYMLAGGGGGGGGGGADARMVKEGSVLRIMPAPAWNVHLREEWTVACDWSVESLES
ncbi:hypothetical protein MY1884_002437 [Beauveria asiatica]